MATTVLIIDDEEKLRRLLARIISLEGYRVQEAATLASAEQSMIKAAPDILLCDVKLPDGNGVDFTKKIKALYPKLEVVLLTAYGNIADGVQAMRNGAYDYLVKGDDQEKIIPLLAAVSEKIALRLKSAPEQNRAGFDAVTGRSAALLQAVADARKVAATNTTVLLTGETGTGKEVFAKAIHAHSARAAGPFIALNCSSFSKELLESELFGYKAGAFTGAAAKDRKGLVDEANGGTLFLDELGELPPELQPKLLRLLEDGSYYRIGDSRQHTADIRIIAATNRNLPEAVAAGNFRSDLYYRIAVFTITLPALRERQGDIPFLAAHFLTVFAARLSKPIQGFNDAARAALRQYAWPGNIRELKNVMERAVILEDSPLITLQSLPYALQQSAGGLQQPAFSLAAVEQQHIRKVMEHTGGHKAEAARLLGIGIATLYRKLEEYKLKM